MTVLKSELRELMRLWLGSRIGKTVSIYFARAY